MPIVVKQSFWTDWTGVYWLQCAGNFKSSDLDYDQRNVEGVVELAQGNEDVHICDVELKDNANQWLDLLVANLESGRHPSLSVST